MSKDVTMNINDAVTAGIGWGATTADIYSWFREDRPYANSVLLGDIERYLLLDLPTTWEEIMSQADAGDGTCVRLKRILSADTKLDSIALDGAVDLLIDSLVANANVPGFTADDKTALMALSYGPRWRAVGLHKAPAPDEIEMERPDA